MKIEAKVFITLGIFFIPLGFVYGYLTNFKELVGFPAIEMTAGLVLMIGFYLNLTAKHSPNLPEDNLQGEISDGAGDQGFYSPWSWWPLVLATAATIMVIGLSLGFWMCFIAIGIAAVGLVGWVFEYSRGDHAH